MTVKDMMTNEERKNFRILGIKAKCYGMIGKAFKSFKYLDKSKYCLDKRWELMCMVLDKHGVK